jgi:hypothetical protein
MPVAPLNALSATGEGVEVSVGVREYRDDEADEVQSVRAATVKLVAERPRKASKHPRKRAETKKKIIENPKKDKNRHRRDYRSE